MINPLEISDYSDDAHTVICSRHQNSNQRQENISLRFAIIMKRLLEISYKVSYMIPQYEIFSDFLIILNFTTTQ